jgi:SAM-dependent methyltransferase
MADEWPIDELFDEDYLHLAARRFTDETDDAAAALVWRLLGLEEGAEVLDLACGHGRIANRLAQRGASVTGLDATPLFLDVARRDARQRGVRAEYVEGDMRAIRWTDRFDAVVSWFTAYGYFDDEQNRAVLAEVHRSLRPGGRFLVELIHKDGLLPHWLPSTVERLGDDVVIDERTYDPLTGRVHTRRITVRDGRLREASFFVRLFGFIELRDWLLQAGFRTAAGYAGDGSALTAASSRMILVAEKHRPVVGRTARDVSGRTWRATRTRSWA